MSEWSMPGVDEWTVPGYTEERVLGRGSVALPSSILRLLRALSPQQVGCVISILFRLRYPAPSPVIDLGETADVKSLLDPATFLLGARLKGLNFAQLSAFAADRVAELADSLLLAQPQLCAATLLDGGFRDGRIPAEPAARRLFRNIHAVHRESLVVYRADRPTG